MKIGLTLPNRGVMFGVTTTNRMLAMAEHAEESGFFQSIWVGDSLLAKPRVESIVLLTAIAARTTRVTLGTACMASFPLRDPVLLAYQWASLDLISGGRSALVVCTGLVDREGGEGTLYQIGRRDRISRMVEWIKILHLLWTEDDVSFQGEHYSFQNVTIAPKPARKPRPPIYIASNVHGDSAVIEKSHRRVARYADGWETALVVEEDLAERIKDLRSKWQEEGRDPSSLWLHSYHNININEDAEAAYQESQRFLDQYYGPVFRPERVRQWVAHGTPDVCVQILDKYKDAGFDEITLRITSWSQEEQYRRLVEEVIPLAIDRGVLELPQWAERPIEPRECEAEARGGVATQPPSGDLLANL